MSIDLSQFIPSFLEESFEGLSLMESSLLSLEPGDSETINSIFRAAHSIKGGAGTFGFNRVTEFTHLVETLLDEMRDGRRTIEPNDVELLLASVDCIRGLIESARDNTDCDEQLIKQVTDKLTYALNHKAENTDSEETTNSINEAETSSTPTETLPRWVIDFIPEHHLVQTGNDPLLLFNALTDLGTLEVEANIDELPALDQMDVEELYMSWRLILHSDCTEEDIREIFEWVEDECELIIESSSASSGSEQERIDEESKTLQNDVVIEEKSNAVEELSSKNSEQTNIEPEAEKNTAIETIEQASIEQIEPQSVNPAAASTANKTPSALKNKAEVSSIRVGVDKVDTLINLVGELVITQSMLTELGNNFDLDKVERLNVGLEQLLQNTKELQESVMRIRMLPISFAFNRFPRLVHDLSIKTGKKMELVIKGEQTELDKTVMEQIGDPLTHLVRNAVDHGIESGEERIKSGKPESGIISLDAFHQGGNIVIEICDDGGGINRQAVLNKALEKGIVEQGMSLTDSQVFDLLFEPGFSTAKVVSDISGRGVGMDVVKRNIQSLGGRIQVESTAGEGSTFRVILPLTLAILDGQLIRVGTETYIIPLISIVESLQTQQENIHHASGDMLVYRLRDDNIPIISIDKLFNIPADTQELDQSLLVVVEADGQKIGLKVDDLLAQQQVVIKSLQDNYQQVDGISGATILGNGSVALILDIPGIMMKAMRSAQEQQTTRIKKFQQSEQLGASV